MPNEPTWRIRAISGRTGLVVLVGIILAGIALWRLQQTRQPDGPIDKLILGAETIPLSAPIWVAEHKGYFREESIEVEVRGFKSGRTALFTLVDEGGLDLVTAAQTPVISKSFSRSNYAIVAGLAYSDKDLKLLARRDRGIASPQDLKGKTIGLTTGSSGHFFLHLFLAYHQLQWPDVKTADFEATALGAALVDGQVDAVATWEPHIYRTRKALSEKAVLMPSGSIYREDFYFIARKECIQRSPEALRRFLKAIEKAQQFIRQHRDETLEIVERRLQMDPEVLRATWSEIQFGLFLDQSILVSLEDEARWAIENQFTTARRAPNFLNYIHSGALLAAKPEAVTMAGTPR